MSMLKVISSSLLVLFAVWYSGTAVANTSPNLRVCNSCTTESYWQATAKNGGVGTHEIYNLETGVVRTYSVSEWEDPQNPNSTILFAQQVSNSQDAVIAMGEAMAMKAEAEAFVNALNGTSTSFSLVNPPEVNGCGPSGHILTLAPDWWELEDACNVHDACFVSGKSFSYCNREFEALLNQYVSDNFEVVLTPYPSGLRFVSLRYMIMMGLAKAYVKGVNSESGFEHFCELTVNTNSLECQAAEPDFIPPNAEFTGLGTSTNAVAATGHSIVATCELWRLPDGNMGYYLMERNCTFVIHMITP